MSIFVETISDLSLGTSTAKTQLDGNRQGSASNWILPASCRAVLKVQPYFYVVTPTSTQTAVASLKVESDDLGVKDYEVLAPPVGDAVATNDTQTADLMRTSIYPLFFPSKGGEQISFYGICQTANTAAPYMGAQVWWSDSSSDLTDQPFRAKIGGTAGSAGSGTSTGTATGFVSGAAITVSGSGQRTLRGASGILAATTAVSAKPQAGWFALIAAELAYTQHYVAEPVQAMLGTGTQAAHLSRVDNISCPLKTPSTISTGINITAASTTAGNFYQGILYN